jgi:hypothetical protein
MSFFIQLLEAIALPVPDFLVLGLVGGTFLTLYCITKACGLAGTADADSGFGIALTLAYFVTVAVDILSHLPIPTPSRITARSRSESQSARHAREFPPRKARAESVEQGGMFTAP